MLMTFTSTSLFHFLPLFVILLSLSTDNLELFIQTHSHIIWDTSGYSSLIPHNNVREVLWANMNVMMKKHHLMNGNCHCHVDEVIYGKQLSSVYVIQHSFCPVILRKSCINYSLTRKREIHTHTQLSSQENVNRQIPSCWKARFLHYQPTKLLFYVRCQVFYPEISSTDLEMWWRMGDMWGQFTQFFTLM
jgi:hypothetical protein